MFKRQVDRQLDRKRYIYIYRERERERGIHIQSANVSRFEKNNQ